MEEKQVKEIISDIIGIVMENVTGGGIDYEKTEKELFELFRKLSGGVDSEKKI